MRAGLGAIGFRDHIETAFGKPFQWLEFRLRIAKALEDFARGKLRLPDGSRADRIYIALPPQGGKSTFLQLFASWNLRIFPGIVIGCAMHNRDKTIRFSRFTRAFYEKAGGSIQTRAIHDWQTSDGGEFWACGKGTTPSGLPANLILTDDLLGGVREANNPGVFRDDLPWLAGELIERETVVHPGLGRFCMCSIGTLWSQADIQAYLLSLGSWYVIRLPGLCDRSRPLRVDVGPFPGDETDINVSDRAWPAPNCHVMEDWREDGDGLAPDGDEITKKLTATSLQARRRKNGGHLSESLFQAIIQQDPRPHRGGRILPREWFPVLDKDPGEYVVQADGFDFGATEGGGDATAWCLMGRAADGLYWIRHSGRAWKGPGSVKRLVAAVMLLRCRESPRPSIVLPVALGDAGKISLAEISRYLMRIASNVGIYSPIVRGRSIQTMAKSDEFRSPKHARAAYHGGSLAEAAQPKDWDAAAATWSVPGDVRVVSAPWHAPPFSELVPKPDAELEAIGELYSAIARHLPRERIASLNIDSGRHHEELLEEFHNFSGYPGGQDNLVDAAADAKSSLRHAQGWGVQSI